MDLYDTDLKVLEILQTTEPNAILSKKYNVMNILKGNLVHALVKRSQIWSIMDSEISPFCQSFYYVIFTPPNYRVNKNVFTLLSCEENVNAFSPLVQSRNFIGKAG